MLVQLPFDQLPSQYRTAGIQTLYENLTAVRQLPHPERPNLVSCSPEAYRAYTKAVEDRHRAIGSAETAIVKAMMKIDAKIAEDAKRAGVAKACSVALGEDPMPKDPDVALADELVGDEPEG